MKTVVFIGLPGCGKSTVGQQFAELWGLPFADTDELIEKKTKKTVSQIFAEVGEKGFREIEAEITRKAMAKMKGGVVACGGGVIERRENISVIKQGFVIFLDRPAEVIAREIKIEARPLMKDPDELLALSKRRRAQYMRAADMIVKDVTAHGVSQALCKADNPLAAEFLVIGDPIAHSLSPQLHNVYMREKSLPPNYAAQFVAGENLEAFVNNARRTLKGFNVTMPHKEKIVPFLDGIEGDAEFAGSVNTVTVEDNGDLIGHNTDMEGLASSLEREGVKFKKSNVVIIGSGGVANTTGMKAAQDGAASIMVFSRTLRRALDFAAKVRYAYPKTRVSAGLLFPGNLNSAAANADILINTTPLGMTGVEEDWTDFTFLDGMKKKAVVFDMIYDPPETTLLAEARKRGIKTQNGMLLLRGQAQLADELFLEENQ